MNTFRTFRKKKQGRFNLPKSSPSKPTMPLKPSVASEPNPVVTTKSTKEENLDFVESYVNWNSQIIDIKFEGVELEETEQETNVTLEEKIKQLNARFNNLPDFQNNKSTNEILNSRNENVTPPMADPLKDTNKDACLKEFEKIKQCVNFYRQNSPSSDPVRTTSQMIGEKIKDLNFKLSYIPEIDSIYVEKIKQAISDKKSGQ